jgi:hypothetical protein
MTPKSFDIPDIPDIPGLDDDDAGSGGSGGGGSRRGSRSGGRGRRRRWPWLVSGLVLGVLGTLFLPGLLRPYLPAALRGRATRVEGLVVEKGKEGSRLLLTVDTEEGAMLATFDHKVPEIDLLVARGDSVTLGVRAYRPFVQEPELLGVKKFPGGAARTGNAGEGAAASGTGGAAAAPAGSVAGPGSPTPATQDSQLRRDTTSATDSAAGPREP